MKLKTTLALALGALLLAACGKTGGDAISSTPNPESSTPSISSSELPETSSSKEEKSSDVDISSSDIAESSSPAEQIDPNDVFDPNNVIFSAPVWSDEHIGYSDATVNNSTTFDTSLTAFKQLYGGKYDAFLSCGDQTQDGKKAQVEEFVRIYKKHFDLAKTPLMFSHGNHDTYWSGCMSTQEFYTAYGEDVYQYDLDKEAAKIGNRHMKINGINIFAINVKTYMPDINDFTDITVNWATKVLTAAYEEDPLKPMILLCHSPASNTVFGSMDSESSGKWGASKMLDGFIKQFPNLILFSGHTHYAANDDRSIYQKDYTAVTIGSSCDIDLDTNVPGVTNLADRRTYSYGNAIEIDAKYNIRITRFDMKHGSMIKTPWDIPHPKADKSHLEKYSTAYRTEHNVAPHLEGNFTVTWNANTNFILHFNTFKDDDMVYAYRVRIFVGTEADILDEEADWLAEEWWMDDWYNYPQGKDVQVDKTINGKYSKRNKWTIKLYAYDSFGGVGSALPSEVIDER